MLVVRLLMTNIKRWKSRHDWRDSHMPETEFKTSDVTAISSISRWKNLLYLGVLILLVAFCDPNESVLNNSVL